MGGELRLSLRDFDASQLPASALFFEGVRLSPFEAVASMEAILQRKYREMSFLEKWWVEAKHHLPLTLLQEG